MAKSRTLKLSILADVDNLKKELDKGSKEVEGFGGKLEKFSAAAKAAFLAAAAAAAAYAAKLAVEGVKAAIEDEAAQKRLATALENVTGATEAQIAAVEKQILKTSLATGVADDQLRPALQRLAVATGSVTESQDLLSLALDISAGTGKDVETVANALAKAYEGNTSSLSRLGVGISATEAKTLGFQGVVKQLSDTFGGTAASQAQTFEGRIARLQVAFDETKETVGAALLPIIEKLLSFITEKAIPAFADFKKSAIDPVIKAFKDNEDAIRGIYDFGVTFLVPFIKFTLGNAIKGLATVASGIVSAVSIALKALEPIVNAGIAAINAFIRAKNLLTSGPDTPTIDRVDFSRTNRPTGSNTIPQGGLPFGGSVTVPGKPEVGGSNRLIAGGVNVPSVSTTATPSIAVPTVPVSAAPGAFDAATFRLGEERSMAGLTINVNAPSAIDEEGFTRAVILALNNSERRSGGGSSQLIL